MSPEAIVSLAVMLLDAVLKLVGPGHAKALITLSGDEVARANAVADAVEALRFSPAAPG